ncbi:MAG TPA: ethanolamine utilization microcompartment protein EutL [Anaerovoracaceae bacterium]|nr:ethanolamine utilization microcompartment protein EutL [Anaerovoracaceae bacterium]
MKNDPIRASILSIKIISNVDPNMAKSLELKPHQKSIGLVTTNLDDVSYTALDEATKKADVEVVYARSLYGGAANANTKLAGEFIGIIAGPDPAEVKSGINAIKEFLDTDACFYSANEDDSICYYAYTISRSGSYLSKVANIPEGESIAYLIAPPMEAMYGLDAALKAADVMMAAFYGPPSETNFGGGLLTGSQSSCKAACEAFKNAVIYVAENPVEF